MFPAEVLAAERIVSELDEIDYNDGSHRLGESLYTACRSAAEQLMRSGWAEEAAYHFLNALVSASEADHKVSPVPHE